MSKNIVFNLIGMPLSCGVAAREIQSILLYLRRNTIDSKNLVETNNLIDLKSEILNRQMQHNVYGKDIIYYCRIPSEEKIKFLDKYVNVTSDNTYHPYFMIVTPEKSALDSYTLYSPFISSFYILHRPMKYKIKQIRSIIDYVNR